MVDGIEMSSLESEKHKPESRGSRPSFTGLVISILAMNLAVTAVACITLWEIASSSFQPRSSPPVVVLDLYGLQQAKLRELQGSGVPFDVVSRQGEEFARNLDLVLSDYREAGMVVVNRSAVITSPSLVDVTELIAGRLDVSYVKAAVPGSGNAQIR